MNRYPLHNINDREFEELTALICEVILGIGTIHFAPGRDKGRDAKFNGKAVRYPSESNPWDGKFVIQVKHTSSPIASCSDPDFSSLLKKEIPKIKRLKEENKVDYYLLFTNRKLSGGQDEKIENFVDEEIGIPNQVIGNSNIQLWLEKYPAIAKTLNLNKLLLPLQFYEEDIRNVIVSFSKSKIRKSDVLEYENIFNKIPIEEKNSLNNLTKDYFSGLLKRSYNEFFRIEKFLEDPKNIKYRESYDNTVSDLREEIVIHRDDYVTFDLVLNHLFKLILDQGNNELINGRKLIRVFLHYMYAHCDIGRSE